MRAYYNENDPYPAQWLRNLISAGLIAPGDVDERSIVDVSADDLAGYTQCHFFAGIGVWSHSLRLAGWADDTPVWTGSCPCQPFSAAGKGGGLDDERHLWPAFYHLIERRRPGVVFGEQVASKDGLAWLDLVQADMEATDYAFAALDLCAAGFGAPHIRQRLYWLADAFATGELGIAASGGRERLGHQPAHVEPLQTGSEAGDADRPGPINGFWRDVDWLLCRDGKWRPVEPDTFPLAHGATSRVGKLRAYGNAIVAAQAAEFIAAYIDIVKS